MNTFEVTSGALMASDPCYKTDVWCAGKIENVKNGTWQFEIFESDHHADRGRVSELWVYTEGGGSTDWERVKSSFGVDSGQFGFFDYKYFLEHENEREYGSPGFYQSACDATSSEERAGVIEGIGAVSSSGYGDGSYNVYVQRDKQGLITAAKVIFIDDSENDEDYEFDEE